MPGMGHAEAACSTELVDRIGRWVDQATSPARPGIARDETSPPSPPEAPAQTPNAAA
jgi:hypothetical protein